MAASAQTTSECFPPKPDRHVGIDGMVPRRIAADGGHADIDDSNSAQARQVKDPAFHEIRGMTIDNTAQSTWVYRTLRNVKAGIAAGKATSSKQVVSLSAHVAVLSENLRFRTRTTNPSGFILLMDMLGLLPPTMSIHLNGSTQH